MSDTPLEPNWEQAENGKWYPPGAGPKPDTDDAPPVSQEAPTTDKSQGIKIFLGLVLVFGLMVGYFAITDEDSTQSSQTYPENQETASAPSQAQQDWDNARSLFRTAPVQAFTEAEARNASSGYCRTVRGADGSQALYVASLSIAIDETPGIQELFDLYGEEDVLFDINILTHLGCHDLFVALK